MLHFIEFKNHQSFRDRTVVSFMLNDKTSQHGWQAVSNRGQRLSTCMAVMGANASGKTAALKALAFVDWFMKHSFKQPPDGVLPVMPHMLDSDKPSEFVVEAEDADNVADGKLWRYELCCTPTLVLREAIFQKAKGESRFKYVFLREWDDVSRAYKIKQQGFGFNAKEAAKVRPNASLIATAAQYGVELAAHLAGANVAYNMNVLGRNPFSVVQLVTAAEYYHADEPGREQMVRLLSSWDLGLSDVRISPIEATAADGRKTKQWMCEASHHTSGGNFQLSMDLESSGTQSAFVLLSRLIPVLRLGGVAVIDELDNDLHPHMLEPVLSLFDNPATNPHRAQLFFSCHSPEVLSLLEKSQVLLIEKTDCASSGYRADEITGLRADDNLRAKYLAGALGAVPML